MLSLVGVCDSSDGRYLIPVFENFVSQVEKVFPSPGDILSRSFFFVLLEEESKKKLQVIFHTHLKASMRSENDSEKNLKEVGNWKISSSISCRKTKSLSEIYESFQRRKLSEEVS